MGSRLPRPDIEPALFARLREMFDRNGWAYRGLETTLPLCDTSAVWENHDRVAVARGTWVAFLRYDRAGNRINGRRLDANDPELEAAMREGVT